MMPDSSTKSGRTGRSNKDGGSECEGAIAALLASHPILRNAYPDRGADKTGESRPPSPGDGHRRLHPVGPGQLEGGGGLSGRSQPEDQRRGRIKEEPAVPPWLSP